MMKYIFTFVNTITQKSGIKDVPKQLIFKSKTSNATLKNNK